MTEFEETFEDLAEASRERFEREGSHDHLIYLLAASSTGKLDVQEVPFGVLIHGMPGGDIDSKKERAYRSVASMMVKLNRPGYIEVMEMWVTLLKGDDEEVLRKYNQMRSQYGSLKNVPGRNEMLFLAGRYGQEARSRHWKIGRRDGEVWLQDGDDGFEFGKTPSKGAILDKTALELGGTLNA